MIPSPAPATAVPAVARAVHVMEAIAGASEPLSLAELTAMLGYPKSSLLGICGTLVAGGLLHRTAHGSYELGPRIVGLAHAYLAKSDLTSQFLETWDALAAMPEETVVLSILDGSDVVYVGCRNGTQGLTFNYRIGMRLAASCTASGKAMLSTLAPDVVVRMLNGRSLQRLTANSHNNVKSLLDDLALIRARGYAIDDQEVRDGMCCVGAPVYDSPSGSAAAAVAVSMLRAEFQGEKRERAIATVTRFASELSKRLGGYRSPASGPSAFVR